jgi:tetratricopeptide (TPR) repeat protein
MKMNRKKLPVLMGLSLLAVVNMFAGNNEKGIEYYRAELYGAAKLFFLQQTNQSASEKAENYYYLGQTYYQLNQEDSASYYYKKAIEVFPEYPFGYIGEGMLQLKKGNTKVAEELFKKAGNFAKKDPSVQTTIAEVYMDLGNYENANAALEKARKINNKYSGIYLAEGDMLMKQGKVGEACTRYENAILFNKSDKVAYLKIAQVYKDINTQTALLYLDKLVALDANYIPAYAVIGDINRDLGMYKNWMIALDAYEKFIAIPGVPLLQHERYAQLLFFTEQYPKALAQIKYVISQDPNNLVMKRLEAYNSFRMENYSLGLEQITQFLKDMPEARHIYQDYSTYGQLALKEKQPELAIKAFQKAIELDSVRAETDKLYKEMATVATSGGKYSEAINYYEKYFSIDTSPDALDYFNYAQANYNAAIYYIDTDNMASVKTPEEIAAYEVTFKSYVQKGDNAYAEVIKRRPNMHIGYMGRANINALVDNYDQNRIGKVVGYAKPLYEEALAMMLENNSDGARNKDILAAYRYLLSYYGALNNIPTVIDYSKLILQIDPNDEQAKKTLTLLKVKY